MIKCFTDALASENNLDEVTAERLTKWLTAEGVLDFTVINETYEGVRE
jgi:hypothetical protein